MVMFDLPKQLLVCCCLLSVAGCAVYNAPVVDALSEGRVSERSERLLLLQLPDQAAFPVRYIERDDCLFLGAGGGWWQALEQQQTVSMVLQGRSDTRSGQAFPDHPAGREVARLLRDRWPRWMRNWFSPTLVVLAPEDPQTCLAHFAVPPLT